MFPEFAAQQLSGLAHIHHALPVTLPQSPCHSSVTWHSAYLGGNGCGVYMPRQLEAALEGAEAALVAAEAPARVLLAAPAGALAADGQRARLRLVRHLEGSGGEADKMRSDEMR